jgi:hypothetical protein
MLLRRITALVAGILAVSAASASAAVVTPLRQAPVVRTAQAGHTSGYPATTLLGKPSDTTSFTQPVARGTRTLIRIANSSAPTRFTFKVALPPDTHFRATITGADVVTSKGLVVATVGEPWAKDANGKPVPTSYAVHGNQIVQTVQHSGAAYPVTADPSVSWHWWGLQVYFTSFETWAIGNGPAAAALYFGWTGWPALVAWGAAAYAAYASAHHDCVAINYYWNGWWFPWMYWCN